MSDSRASGLDGHQKYRIRRAIQLWVGRARIRRGLRRQVWTCAQKGPKELLKLLDMMEQAEQEDLANAIVARDSGGQTPLLWAAKKGFAEVPRQSRTRARARCCRPNPSSAHHGRTA